MASLWEYANPRKFMDTSAWLLPWATGIAVLCLVTGLVWGFFFTPDDFRQGSTVKIIFIHVPAAIMAINAWLMMLV
ncbi:MAG: transcriptional regulator, partial [Roseicyclus sp.]